MVVGSRFLVIVGGWFLVLGDRWRFLVIVGGWSKVVGHLAMNLCCWLMLVVG